MSLDISPGQFVTAPDGTKIWAAACGNPSKPAVVFVHGFACTSDVFEKQYTDAMMLENLYIIRYDLRGCGRSEGPLNAEAYSSERQAGDFKAVIDAYGVHKPFVATWSMGGIVPPDVVAKYGPDSLAGQILIGSFPHHNMHSEIIHPHIVSLIPGLITEDIALFAKTLPDFVLACFAPEYELPYDVYAKWIGGTAPRPPIVRQSMLMRKQDETAIMAAAVNQLPYLVIHGGEDQHLFAWKLEKWLKDHQFSQYEFHLLPGVGHSPFYEAPDVTNKLILKFVQEHYHDSDSTCST